ncbi:Phosphoglucomutase [Fulvivirga imtechensis AK7]|uniref:Phosphoglucomutase n=1 Tax=Fulvivirga imtechensis AK7 TaxID=1237149 RepID=L8JL48_9BACT|nr:phospho-sugar mutase [Fulvivirga imtechensis]ELR68953.1 Phosphoglucomutase [Fulvivirga imtechensis AK7]
MINTMNEIVEKAQRWLDSNIDPKAKAEIESLMKNEEALTEAFYKDLEFGTGGLRGIMGIGSNRMNKYTIGMATQGLANYLLKTYPNEQVKVALAHDSRNNSRYFAETVAAVFSANNIKVYLFEDLRPTPELSFAIRHLKCHSGVVLTASHNPKEYNGYKAYWNDGAQLVAPHDKNVIDEVNKISSIDEVKFDTRSELIEEIGQEIDQLYLNEIKKLSLSPDSIKEQKDIKIVYSPIHGTGVTLVPQCLKDFGFENIYVVEEQSEPNGNFPTVVYPNPEEAEALKLALQKAKEIDAELVMATDPDADRVGIAIKDQNGEFQLLNGNQTGSLLMYYVLKRWKELNKFEGNEYVVKTIVTTQLMDKIAERFGVACYNTLTGFKYIASIIRELEGKNTFVVGGEESYGYMISDFVRDKDAVASCAMIAEMCAYARSQGKSLFDLLIEVYTECGFYKEKLISLTKKGKKGADEIKSMMQNYRSTPPVQLAGSKVIKVIDYQSSEERDLVSGKTTAIDFEKSNVLQFFTEDGYKISARPSGTEPKIKFYISVNKKLSSKEDFEAVNQDLDKLLAEIEHDLQ